MYMLYLYMLYLSFEIETNSVCCFNFEIETDFHVIKHVVFEIVAVLFHFVPLWAVIDALSVSVKSTQTSCFIKGIKFSWNKME